MTDGRPDRLLVHTLIGAAVGMAVLIVALSVVALSTSARVTDASVRRDEIGRCVSIVTGRWQAAVSLSLAAEPGTPDRARYSAIALEIADVQRDLASACYGEYPDPGPDPFAGGT